MAKMKYLISTILLVSVFLIGQSQEIFVDQTFYLNNDFKNKIDSSLENRIYFSPEEKKHINNNLILHLQNGFLLHEGYIFCDENFLPNGNINTNSDNLYFGSIDKHNSIFSNDSVLVKFDTLIWDKFGEVIYNEEGYEVYDTICLKKSVKNSILRLNSIEKWNYEKQKFNKTINAIGVDFCYKISEHSRKVYQTYFINNSEKGDFETFKMNVNFIHYFYPKYYSIFLNNDSIWKNSYVDYVEIGTKASSQNNQFEIKNLLEPLFRDIQQNKLTLQRINEKGEITKNNIKSHEIKELFWIQEEHHLDENGEPMYDEEGDAIYFSSKMSISPDMILGIEFYEDWYLGKGTFQFKKEIKGIVLIRAEYNDIGLLVGMKKIPAYISFE